MKGWEKENNEPRLLFFFFCKLAVKWNLNSEMLFIRKESSTIIWNTEVQCPCFFLYLKTYKKSTLKKSRWYQKCNLLVVKSSVTYCCVNFFLKFFFLFMKKAERLYRNCRNIDFLAFTVIHFHLLSMCGSTDCFWYSSSSVLTLFSLCTGTHFRLTRVWCVE